MIIASQAPKDLPYPKVRDEEALLGALKEQYEALFDYFFFGGGGRGHLLH